MPRPTWRGGHRLKRFIREVERAAKDPPVIEIGFKDKRIAPLAAAHEFGHASTNLPERPAFRNSLDRVGEVVVETILEGKRGRVAREGFGIGKELAAEVAVAARDEVRASYDRFHGEPLSERQRARKRGTAYETDQLVGSEGPKLIGHIRAFVDGEEVG